MEKQKTLQRNKTFNIKQRYKSRVHMYRSAKDPLVDEAVTDVEVHEEEGDKKYLE